MTRASSAPTAERLFGWTPFRASWRDDAPRLDWCHLDGRRMVEPFFFETVAQAMREPFNLVFEQDTPIEALAALPPGLPVAGLVFHMGRCGATLIARMLAAFESNIVVAEAQPLSAALELATRVGEQQVAAWVAGLANAYAQQRFAYERRLILKFAPADVLDIAMVRRALPEVPWVFVTRDPAAILASLARAGGDDLRRGRLPAARLGVEKDAMWAMDKAEYHARVLAAFARAAGDALAAGGVGGGGLLLDHADLPEALWTALPAHFGLRLDEGATAAVRTMAERHAKLGEAYRGGLDPDRVGAAAFRAIADGIAGPPMAELATLRGSS